MSPPRAASFGSPSSDLSEKKTVLITPGSDKDKDPAPPAIAMENVKEPHANDVLCGRGGSINSHPGNERFRLLVEKRKRVYLTARFKREKRLIANSIVTEIRKLDPPGRFLTKNSKTGSWNDIGDEKARDKTSQALRENAPSIRAEIEVEINHKRAEMQREEEEAARRAHQQYYGQWGYQHGGPYPYGQYPPPDPNMPYGPPPPEGYHHPHPSTCSTPTHAASRSFSYEEESVHSQHSHGSTTSRRGRSHRPYPTPQRTHSHDHSPCRSHHSQSSHVSPSPHQPPSRTNSAAEDDRSAFDSIPDFVNSVPASLAAWTKNSFSFGGHSTDQHDFAHHPSQKNKPYTPQRDGRGRAVHFKECGCPQHHPQQHPGHAHHPGDSGYHRNHQGMYSPIRDRDAGSLSNSVTSNSITPDGGSKKSSYSQAMEPAQQYGDETGEHPGLLSQVANHILGSWDATSYCGSHHGQPGSAQHQHIMPAPPMPMPNSQYSMASSDFPEQSLADNLEPVEEEGQEVELVDMMDYNDDGVDHSLIDMTDDDRSDVEARRAMPPPPVQQQPQQQQRPTVEVDWTSRFGCQSTWLPDSFGTTPSFFSATRPGQEEPSLPHPGSLDMDVSAMGTENFSCGSSLGGGSLTHVFTSDSMSERRPPSPTPEEPYEPDLDQVPSWDPSLQGNLPLSVCSDSSIVSARDEKPRARMSPPGSRRHSMQSIGSDEMKWDQE